MGAMTRHELLFALHQRLKPKVYLEIGIQFGSSLVLAEHAEMAVGVDPDPLIGMSPNQRPNQRVFSMTSDDFFEKRAFVLPPVDLAFIDGMHLVEYALRDFVNVQKFMRPGGVIVFDDVLPYNSPIAERVQPPGGDWTGDVWKLYYILTELYRIEPLPVDTWPTGTMVLLNVDPRPSLEYPPDLYMAEWIEDCSVPGPVLNRTIAVQPDEILEGL